MIAFYIIIILLGVVMLVAGSELVVPSAQRIARRFKVSELVIGLTLLGIGSSLPEIATNIKVGLTIRGGMDISGIAIGNVIGSCISQITLIVGIAALVGRLNVNRKILRRDGVFMLFAVFLSFLVMADLTINRLEAITLIVLYLFYLLFLTRKAYVRQLARLAKQIFRYLPVREDFIVLPEEEEDVPKKKKEEKTEDEEEKPVLKKPTLFLDIVLSFVGIGLVIFGAEFIVTYGEKIATILKISQGLVGIFIGLGTSLPELTISLRALSRGSGDIAIGNIIGSNIADPLLSLGIGASIASYTIPPKILFFEFPFWAAISVIFLLMLWDNDDLDRYEGMILITLYCLFIFYSIFLLIPAITQFNFNLA